MPRMSDAAAETAEEVPEKDHLGTGPGPDAEDIPDLLRKLQERKLKHENASLMTRIRVIVTGVVLVLAGIVMSGPGVPGPGILVILVGLSFLALEFEWAERLLERAIIWADKAADRAQSASKAEKILSAVFATAIVAGFVVWAILGDIWLVPFV